MLSGKGIFTSIQKKFIELFSRIPDQEQFYLTGGTALSEYYLGHRLSFDIDFFTGVVELILPVSYQVEKAAVDFGIHLYVKRRFASYVEFIVTENEEELRIDLALDSPFRFKSPVLSEQHVWINSFQDIRIDKLLAFFGRVEPREGLICSSY
jgi:predicted nucleotidyltransferase component of viral defense system